MQFLTEQLDFKMFSFFINFKFMSRDDGKIMPTIWKIVMEHVWFHAFIVFLLKFVVNILNFAEH